MKHFKVLLLVLLCACGKEGKTPTPVPPVDVLPEFSISKTEALPLEVIIISLAGPSDATSLKGKIGSADFEARKISNGQYGFFVPEISPEGTHLLSIAGNGKTLSFKVGKAPVITNPEQYNREFLVETKALAELLKASHDSLISQGYLTAAESGTSLSGFTAVIDELQKVLTSASPADAAGTAAFIGANRALIESVFLFVKQASENPAPNARINSARQLSYADDELGINLRTLGQELATRLPQVAYLCSALSLAIVSYAKLDPRTRVFILSLSAAIHGINLLIARVYRLKAVLDTSVGMLLTNAAEQKNFGNNVAREIIASVPTRTVDAEYFENSADPDVRNVGKNLSDLRKQLEKPEIAEYIDVDLLEFKPQAGEVLIEDPSRLTVEVLNNSGVKVTISNFGIGSFDLSFSSPVVPANFDYRISYRYAGVPVTETITGNSISGIATLTLSTPAGVPFTKPGEVGRMYHFQVDGYSPKKETRYQWNFGDGRIRESQGNNSEFHSYDQPGAYTVSVTVSEGATTVGSASGQANIKQKEPYFLTTDDGIPISKPGVTDKSYTFTVEGETWRASAKSVVIWSFGDGTPQEEILGNGSVRHVFTKEGTFALKARIFPEDGALDEHVAEATATIGSGQESDYYLSFDFGGSTIMFTSKNVNASFLGGRLDLFGSNESVQAGIFFSPASLFQGVGAYSFAYDCHVDSGGSLPNSPESTAIGAFLYHNITYTTLACSRSGAAGWGCIPNTNFVSPPNGQITITRYDTKVIEGTFYYTDMITGTPVANGKFKLPVYFR